MICANHEQQMNYVVGPYELAVDDFLEVGIWCSCQQLYRPSASSNGLQRFTYTSGTNSGGKKIVDRDFDAIATLYSHKAKLFGNSDITKVNITPPAAFEFVCALGKGREMGCVSCSHCGYPHLDLGDFARTPHRKHFCANCGRDSTWSKTAIVSTPLKPLHDQYPQAKVFTEPDRSVSPTTTMVVGTPSGPRLPPYFGQLTALKKKEYVHIHDGTKTSRRRYVFRGLPCRPALIASRSH